MTVAESELKWVPLLTEDRAQLVPGHKVATEGQRQWRMLLTEAAGGKCNTSYLCKGNVRFEPIGVEEIVAVKVERLTVHSIDGVSVSMRQHEGRHGSPLFLDDRGGCEVVRRLYGEAVWNVQGLPPKNFPRWWQQSKEWSA